MSTNLPTTQDEAPPAWLAEYRELDNDDEFDVGGAPIAAISIKGSKWSARFQRQVTPLLDPATGHSQAYLDVIFIAANPAKTKTYYLTGFKDGEDKRPDCTSVDGINPDPQSPAIQNPPEKGGCGLCPKNQWGSRVRTDGTRTRGKECQDNKRAAVLLASDPVNERFGGAMLLRIPPGSFTEFTTYKESLKPRGRKLRAGITRMSFEHGAAYPKIKFEWMGFLPEDFGRYVASMVTDEHVQRIISVSQVDTDTDGESVEQGNIAPVQAPAVSQADVAASTQAAAKVAARVQRPTVAASAPPTATTPVLGIVPGTRPVATVVHAAPPPAPATVAPAPAPAPAPTLTPAQAALAARQAAAEKALAEAERIAAEVAELEAAAASEQGLPAAGFDAATGEVYENGEAGTSDDFLAKIDEEIAAIPS